MNPFIKYLQKKSEGTQQVVFENGKAYSYYQLFDESRRLASYLKSKGMQEGQTVFIACEPGFEFLRIIYATIMLKVKVALIDPHMGRDLYQQKIRQLKPDWGFIDSRLMLLQEHPILRWAYNRTSADKIYIPFSKDYQKVVTGLRLPLLQKHHRFATNKKYEPIKIENSFIDHEYIITYTSGTTHSPKGVVHSILTVNNSINLIVDILQKNKGDTLATHLPHFMLIGICAGIKVHLWKEKWSAKQKVDFILKNKISVLFGPPADYLSLIKYCKKTGIKLPKCLKHVLIGSAPVHVPFLENLTQYLPAETKITLTYGMTENLIVASTDGREKIKYKCHGDLLGQPLEGIDIKIQEDHEILLSSPQLFKKYLGKAYQKSYHPTGDLGYLDEGGNLILTGRKKDMIIRGNFNIYPGLYEPTIKKIPGIIEAIMIGKYMNSIADERVFLFVETEEKMTQSQIMSLLQSGQHSIDKEALPDEIIFGSIPRKGRQAKIDKAHLRDSLNQENN